MSEEITLERVQELVTRAPFHKWLGLKVVAVHDDGIELTATWREEWVVNPDRRYTHGGVLAALVDLRVKLGCAGCGAGAAGSPSIADSNGRGTASVWALLRSSRLLGVARSSPLSGQASFRSARHLGGLRLVYGLDAIEKPADIALRDLNVIVVLQIEPKLCRR